MIRQFLKTVLLLMVCCTLVIGCGVSLAPTVRTTTGAPAQTVAPGSPLPMPDVSPVEGTAPTPEQTVVAATPERVSVPGVPDEIVYYVGVARYLMPRVPTQQVLDQWSDLSPPSALARSHEGFAQSMREFIDAHQAFNDVAFKRSTASPRTTSERLSTALKSHRQKRQDLAQELDQFLLTEYKVSLSEIPPIVVPIEP